MTTARFPHLLDSAVMAIISGGLDQARQNYNKKYDELVANALEAQNDQIKSSLCAAMAASGAPQCTSYISVDGTAICESYEAPKLEAVFGSDDEADASVVGISGTDLYSTKYTITGANMSELASVMQSGRSEYTQVDSMGNMLGKITMSSVYSAENNTCTITTVTTMCDTMEQIILTTELETCGTGGISVAGGSGCRGGGGIINIGGSGSKTSTTQEYAGTQCTAFMDPITTTTTVEM